MNDGINTSKEKDIRTLLYFLTVKGYTRKKEDEVHNMEISRLADMELTIKRFERRLEVSRFAIEWLYRLTADTVKGNNAVQFSVVELLNQIKSTPQSFLVGLTIYSWKTWRKHFYICQKSVRSNSKAASWSFITP